MNREHRQLLDRYALAVAVVAAAATLTLALQPLITPVLYPFFILSVAVATIAGGRGPGVLATVLSLVALRLYFFPTMGQLTAQSAADIAREASFVLVSVTLIVITGSIHPQRLRLQRQAEENERLRGLAEAAATAAEQATGRAVEALHRAEEESTRAIDAAMRADVSSREAAEALVREQASQEAAARLAAIVSSSSDAIIAKTLDGTITSWNSAAERIFGYSRDEMVGQSVLKLIPPELHATERDLLRRLRAGEIVEFAESERIRKDGTRIWISLSVSPVRDPSGAITGAASIKRDVTERRLVQERLQDTQRLQAVGQLAGGMAHEANNQMSVVLGSAHFLLRRDDLPAAARQDIEQIRHAAERTASVTQQLLAFSRRQRLTLQNIDLNAVVRSMSGVLRRSLSENQTLELRLGTLGRAVRADPRQVEQVLLNLTLNARDAMPDGGRLTIETGGEVRPDTGIEGLPSAGYEVLTVSDSGHGMDETTRERAFEPFFTTKDVGQGTGLGLSVVHGIINQMGGAIRLDTAPGQGASFMLYFPLAPAADPDDTPLLPPSPAPVQGLVALVVEDDPYVRGMVTRTLADVGYIVLEAADGRLALDRVQEHRGRLDLVVSDVGMPGLDGYELARRLLVLRPGLPVVLMTGYGDSGHAANPAPASVRSVLQKPFSPDFLILSVAEVLGRGERGDATSAS